MRPEVPVVPAPACTASAPIPPSGLEVGGQRFGVGAPGDEAIVRASVCGPPVALLLRPATGAVLAFPAWPTRDHPQTAITVVELPDPHRLETGTDPCTIVARAPDGTTHPVEVPR